MINHNADLWRVNSRMLCEQVLSCVSFAAFVALERFQPRMRHHVLLQITGLSASIIALVTLERLFSCVVSHYVLFQFTSCNAGKLARFAYVRLFLRVGSFVALQMA